MSNRIAREAPLPDEMQGLWIAADEPDSELSIHSGEITCFGAVVEYDFKTIVSKDKALTVSLGIEDPAKEDTFRRSNITGLVITPEGDFYGYNVKFASYFVWARDRQKI